MLPRARAIILSGLLLFTCVVSAVAERRSALDAAAHERQAQVLERALIELQPTRADHAQLYFGGFAGYGSQGVFMREVVAVRKLFDDRFDTNGRSIALINGESTLDDVPLANDANLARVLQHVGSLMDTGRDTLFLFLTSHGDKGRLAVEMPGYKFRPLTPQRLAGMLDASGIKNRVIVVSACHSGSFIPALATPTTLVIAAARADRSSFGCEDRRRWTYFGDAYFNHALRQETSFKDAFARAKRLIALWELRDKLMPSLPQIAGGEALGPALAGLIPAQ
jgi:hypothetical protein